MADAATAIQTLPEARVPMTISGMPASAAMTYAVTRERLVPPKSAKTSRAITPNTRNVEIDCPRPSSVAAPRSGGTTTAARRPRRKLV